MTIFRDTFSSSHSDVISAVLDSRTIYEDDYKRRFIKYKNCDYILQCDATVRQTVKLTGEAYCLISYQQRTTGFYAMARLHRSQPSSKN